MKKGEKDFKKYSNPGKKLIVKEFKILTLFNLKSQKDLQKIIKNLFKILKITIKIRNFQHVFYVGGSFHLD
jgi:hypothetical protein